MRSIGNNENSRQFNEEIARLRNGFIALRVDYKKGVLKTAQELLKVQQMRKKITADGVRCSVLACKE